MTEKLILFSSKYLFSFSSLVQKKCLCYFRQDKRVGSRIYAPVAHPPLTGGLPVYSNHFPFVVASFLSSTFAL
uniref:Uncharacterized protein n=1 Tax=Siphoviridae sp. ctEgn5 TaxID=2825398 RepID=A0A8S5PH59_9CAUD|nr:MAG TPA: hypothetical protein [Siphoviridae sp. ctEgn5]